MDDYKDYKRFPIQLSSQDIMLIHLFSNKGASLEQSFENHDMTENNQAAFKYSWKESEVAAQQFISQLEGNYCDAFLKALIVEAAKKLAESDKSFNDIAKKLCKEDKHTRMQEALDKAKIEAENII